MSESSSRQEPTPNNPAESKERSSSRRQPPATIGGGGQSEARGTEPPTNGENGNNGPLTVQLTRTAKFAEADILLWYIIRKSSEGLSFNNYKAFMDCLLCGDASGLADLDDFERQRMAGPKRLEAASLARRRFLPFTDTDAYRILKVATEAFITVNCAIPLEETEFARFREANQLEIDALPTLLNAQFSGDLADAFWNTYLQSINGVTSRTIPYLALIRRKLAGTPVIDNFFGNLDRNRRYQGGSSPLAPLTDNGCGDLECYGILMEKLAAPCFLELIWSYWHEEGMLVQTMNALSRRFQNVRGPADRDPLTMIEIDPLRPLNNLLWGYVQDEQHRLSVLRRAYEYDHHYGLTLEGKAVPQLRPADSRSRFVEAFHNLLTLVSAFYKQDDDNTVAADAFPILKALEDLHLLLSEGAHNQFGDLPTTARVEMLMQQWLLARPEFREVLPRRIMVAYPEPWMDSVDAMKRLQGWTDTSVLHFRHLGVYGERVLLSIRFGDWSNTNQPDRAALWARFFRADIQGYIHAYRTVTGVDLAADATMVQQRELIATSPSVLLRKRLLTGRPQAALPAPTTAQSKNFRERRAARQRQPAR